MLISVNGVNRATFIGSKLAVKGALDKHDLSKPITLPNATVPRPEGAGAGRPAWRAAAVGFAALPPGGCRDGAWDERTRHAIIAFQAWHRLDRDGIVGAHTLAALENASQPEPTRATRGRHVEVYRDKGVTLLVRTERWYAPSTPRAAPADTRRRPAATRSSARSATRGRSRIRCGCRTRATSMPGSRSTPTPRYLRVRRRTVHPAPRSRGTVRLHVHGDRDLRQSCTELVTCVVSHTRYRAT